MIVIGSFAISGAVQKPSGGSVIHCASRTVCRLSSSLRDIARAIITGWVMKRKERRTVAFYAEKLRIKTPSQEQRICNLSGGNQQKVILARWMATQPKLLILDEPTRGIDVGAKAEIERLVQDMSENGISVLLISSEMEELVRNCDRIVVIQDGKKIGELAGGEMTEDAILRMLSTQEEKDGGNGR